MQIPIKLKLKSNNHPPCTIEPPDNLLIEVEVDENTGTANIHAEAVEHMINGHSQSCTTVTFKAWQDCELKLTNPGLFGLPADNDTFQLEEGTEQTFTLTNPQGRDSTRYWFTLPTSQQAEVAGFDADVLVAMREAGCTEPQIVVP